MTSEDKGWRAGIAPYVSVDFERNIYHVTDGETTFRVAEEDADGVAATLNALTTDLRIAREALRRVEFWDEAANGVCGDNYPDHVCPQHLAREALSKMGSGQDEAR